MLQRHCHHAAQVTATLRIAVLLVVLIRTSSVLGEGEPDVRLRLTITSDLPFSNTPLDPLIDFSEFIRATGAAGVLNPDSIEVRKSVTGETVDHALTEDFFYGDKGRVEFVVADPGHNEFDITFQLVAERAPSKPRPFTPQIGVDLLRYNAAPRPTTVPYSPGLYDLNRDGQLDPTGTWNYAYRPGWPWDGIVCYAGVSKQSPTNR